MASDMKPRIMIITGSSGSGKSTFARYLTELSDKITLFPLDNLYKDLPDDVQANDYNFDEPNAYDMKECETYIKKLISGETVEIANYDFKTHKRTNDNILTIKPSPIIILEGIHAAHSPFIRNIASYIVFIDTRMDICLGRRIIRDMKVRGRDPEDIIRQWFSQVAPAYLTYTHPIKYNRATTHVITNDDDIQSLYTSDVTDRLLKEISSFINDE